MTTPSSLFSFGAFRLDPMSGQLYRGDEAVPLAPKAFALLQYMAERPGRLIAKRELLDAVWPGVFVGDAVLKTAIRDVRRALADDSHSPRFIETAHRRGYRFIGFHERSDDRAPIHYARSGHVNIAYQVVGSGPRDIVFVMGWVSHLEYFWNEPTFARFLRRLAANARLILFDKRGTGRSDPVPVAELPTLEQRLDDVRAVMEAAGSEHAVLIGVSEGGPLCSLFAATYPQRTDALVMVGSYARRLRDDDYPWGSTREERDRFLQTIIDEWGGPVGIAERAPSRASDPAFRQWWASYLRMGASPGAAVALTRMNADIDIRDVLPSIQAPTLVLHRRGDKCLLVDEGRYLASRIPGARFVELPGDDHLPFVGDQDALLEEIESFLSVHGRTVHGRRGERNDVPDRVLASVLTVQWSGEGPPDFERAVAGARGHVLRRDAHAAIATFDGPGRAVSCAAALVAGDRTARAGVHIGECRPGVPGGPVFEMSHALAESAAPGSVRVSRTVVDLVPGSGLRFEDQGIVSAAGARQQSSRVVL